MIRVSSPLTANKDGGKRVEWTALLARRAVVTVSNEKLVRMLCVCVERATQQTGIPTWNKAGRFLSLCLLRVCAAGVHRRSFILQVCVRACVCLCEWHERTL